MLETKACETCGKTYYKSAAACPQQSKIFTLPTWTGPKNACGSTTITDDVMGN